MAGKNIHELTDRQERFVQEYLIDLNGTKAAIRAGYAPDSAEVTASRLLRKAKVAEAVQRGKAARAAATQITAAKVVENIQRLSDKAEEAGQLSVAMKGQELLGKHCAAFTERLEVSDMRELSDEELDAQIAALGMKLGYPQLATDA
jgi:phage terminase small subunit